MKEAAKPTVVISKCFEFEACRYNGETSRFNFINKLGPRVRFVPICPEVEIGLGIPRQPIRIVARDGENKPVQPATG